MKLLISIALLLSVTTVKADETSDFKDKIKKLALASCMYGSDATTEEYRKLGNKLKIKSAIEICSELLKEMK